MSESNGDGVAPRIATIDELRAAMTTEVTLEGTSARMGAPVRVRIRRLREEQWRLMLPDPVPGQDAWPADEAGRQAALTAYLAALDPAGRSAWHEMWAEVWSRLIAAAVVEPRLSVADARLLTEDSQTLGRSILEFSDLLAPAPAPAPVAEPSEVAAG